jgi:hypothetical protein
MLKFLIEHFDLLTSYFAINKDNEIIRNGFEIILTDRAKRPRQKTHGAAVAISLIAGALKNLPAFLVIKWLAHRPVLKSDHRQYVYLYGRTG